MNPVEEQVKAYNDGDIDRFISCYAPEVIIENAEGKVMMEGHEAMRARYGPRFAANPELNAHIVKRIRVGDYVIDEEEVTGFSDENAPDMIHAAAIYRVLEGKIVHVRFLP